MIFPRMAGNAQTFQSQMPPSRSTRDCPLRILPIVPDSDRASRPRDTPSRFRLLNETPACARRQWNSAFGAPRVSDPSLGYPSAPRVPYLANPENVVQCRSRRARAGALCAWTSARRTPACCSTIRRPSSRTDGTPSGKRTPSWPGPPRHSPSPSGRSTSTCATHRK